MNDDHFMPEMQLRVDAMRRGEDLSRNRSVVEPEKQQDTPKQDVTPPILL